MYCQMLKLVTQPHLVWRQTLWLCEHLAVCFHKIKFKFNLSISLWANQVEQPLISNLKGKLNWAYLYDTLGS